MYRIKRTAPSTKSSGLWRKFLLLTIFCCILLAVGYFIGRYFFGGSFIEL